MPNDLNLYPSIANPQQRQIERTANLEARVAALERKRDIYVTPVDELTANGASFGGAGGSMTFEWHGGALWMILGGRFYTNTTWIEGVLAPTVKLNGAALGPGPVMGWARPNQGGALALVSYSDIPNLAIGTNTLTISIAPASQTTVDRAMIDGLIVEWPYAA